MKLQKKIIWFSVLIMFSSLGGIVASAQTSGFDSAESALDDALQRYMNSVGEQGLWELGEIHQDGEFAFSLAKNRETSGAEEGNLMVLAMVNDGRWGTRTPGLDSADRYNAWLNQFPDSLFSEFEKAYFYQYTVEDLSFLEARDATLHHFPWPIRQNARVTQKDGSYHTNQIDFVVLSSSDVFASKPGVVIFKKESSSTGGCDMGLWEYANLVVIQHSATEYSWYYHLVQNSVTVEVGDFVGYGTKIGVQGNTGYACGTTGIHLHFMVSTDVPSYWPNPTNPAYAPWPPGGTIVKVDFIEATWASLVVGSSYQSQNASPPGMCGADVTEVSFYNGTYCSSYLGESLNPGLVELDLMGSEDKIESIEIPTGMSVRIYLDQNEVGDSVCLNSTAESLWTKVFSSGAVAANRVSWMRVFPSQNCVLDFSNGVLFYPNVNFAGTASWGMIGERSTNAPGNIAKSIVIPGGYSLQLWDQDNFSGNTLCLASSAVDLGVYGWGDKTIQSLQFAQGNICDDPVGDPLVPTLLSPAQNGYVYGVIAPELCWDVQSSEVTDYFVEITGNGSTTQSGWITEKCWQVDEIASEFGEYNWKVQSRTGSNEISDWSLVNYFSYLVDSVGPEVVVTNPVDGGYVVYPRATIYVDTSDLGGVRYVYFFAWYDDGSGAGHDWHFLGVDDTIVDGWHMDWGLLDVVDPFAAVWVYSEDFSGNYTSAFVPQVFVSDSFTFGDGFESRGEGRDESLSDVPPPTTYPEFPGESTSGGNVESIEIPVAPIVEDSGSTESPSSGNNIQVPAPAEPTASMNILTPQNAIFWNWESPVLCWTEVDEAEFYKVKVEWGEESVKSDWIEGTCWRPQNIHGVAGIYRWQVRYQSFSGQRSDWTPLQSFSIQEDLIAPEISFSEAKMLLFPNSGSSKLVVSADASESGSGFKMIYLLAYYDGGDGFEWHQLSEMRSPESSQITFDVSFDEIGLDIQELWIYGVDQAGNVGSANLEGDAIIVNDQIENHPQKWMVDSVHSLFGRGP